MSARASTSLLAVLVLLSASACGPAQERGRVAGVSPLPGENHTSGYVLSGRSLNEHNGSLLDYLFGRVSGMQVDHGSYPCPEVQLRSRKSILGSTDPAVYVDGTRTANACIREELYTRDIGRVEVYPQGVANRPGYKAHPNGLILVFLRNGPAAVEGNDLRRVVMRQD
jgi:hypothetical protein